MERWAERILTGDLRAIARAATEIENRGPQAEPLLKALFPHTGHALIAGITGPPGAGKSTLTSRLASALRAEAASVGIIAVDPSSPFSGGAILGDRIRMQQHHADPGVFIRSMATRGQLGGLARATFEVALLLDAAGRGVILIETVGVGQDEVDIARLADVTAVVLAPGMGDDVQTLKAGMMEIADVFVINKADLPEAQRLEQELKAMLSLAPRGRADETPVVKTVATQGEGVSELLAALRACRLRKRRDPVALWQSRLLEMVKEKLIENLDHEELRNKARAVAMRELDPPTAASALLQSLVRPISLPAPQLAPRDE